MPYAEVAVDAPIRDGRTFTYSIPTDISVAPGQMVQVPFGPRRTDGVVFQLSDTTNIDPLRPIAVSDPTGPVLQPHQLDLARWASDYYMASLYSAAALMLPPAFRNRTDVYIVRPDESALAGVDDTIRASILDMFGSRRRLPEASVRRVLDSGGRRALDRLLDRGRVTREWTWRIPRVEEDVQSTDPDSVAEHPLAPTSHQRDALHRVTSALDTQRHQAFLLQGVTGSGKTEVYLQALKRCLDQGRKGIVLVPEISLTPQTLRRFQARFPGRVAVLHSRLSQADHRRMWWGVYNGRYDVVVGSRSALFAPVRPLGLVVIDEEHEWTYKQADAEPRYHTRAVALRIAQQAGAVVVLGSATPDVVTYHRSLTGRRLELLELPDRIGFQVQPGRQALADVKIVDMRQELKDGNRSIFSRSLQSALQETVSRGEQAILFINRRGTAGIVQCRDCGHVLRCRSCDTPLTYHTSPERLVCHQCNRRSGPVARCPSCRGSRIRYLGLGTQRVVNDLADFIPGVSVLRWDRDVAASDQGHEDVVERFARGEAQVLVGTQMVAKGLHVPSVTLVGAVLADIGLHLPDFRAGERIFQLLCQVAGRAGRGEGAGVAIVQTYMPDHYAVTLAARQDYPAFYRQEAAHREVQRMPPYSRLIRLLFAHTNADRCQREAERLGRALRHQRSVWAIADVDVIGPAPAYPTRVRGRYRWHVLLRGADPRLLLDKVPLNDGWQVDVDPVSVL